MTIEEMRDEIKRKLASLSPATKETKRKKIIAKLEELKEKEEK